MWWIVGENKPLEARSDRMLFAIWVARFREWKKQAGQLLVQSLWLKLVYIKDNFCKNFWVASVLKKLAYCMRVLCIGMMWGTLGGGKKMKFWSSAVVGFWILVLPCTRSVAFHESQGQIFSEKLYRLTLVWAPHVHHLSVTVFWPGLCFQPCPCDSVTESTQRNTFKA